MSPLRARTYFGSFDSEPAAAGGPASLSKWPIPFHSLARSRGGNRPKRSRFVCRELDSSFPRADPLPGLNIVWGQPGPPGHCLRALYDGH